MSGPTSSAFAKLKALASKVAPVAKKAVTNPYMVVPATALAIGGDPLGRFLGYSAGSAASWFRGENPNDIPMRQAMGMNRQAAIANQFKQERFEQAKNANMLRLVKMDPHLYAELSVGRPLPMGAVPIGGQQRADLLDEVTGAMANGDFGPPPMGQQPLM